MYEIKYLDRTVVADWFEDAEIIAQQMTDLYGSSTLWDGFYLQTHMNTLVQLGYKQVPRNNNGHHTLGQKEFFVHEEETFFSVMLGAGIGYGGFCCEFQFDKTGNFINHGCWE